MHWNGDCKIDGCERECVNASGLCIKHMKTQHQQQIEKASAPETRTAAQAQFKTARILCPEVLAHAERLADALLILAGCAERGLDQSPTHDGLSNCSAIAKARTALAAWKGGAQ